MEDSFTTLHPCPIDQYVCIDKAEYEIIRNSILKHLLFHGAMPADKLGSLVESHLKCKLNDSLYRYYEDVRQILEARGEIRYVPRTNPPLIEIAR